VAFTILSDFAIVDSLLHGEVEVSALDAAIVDICEGIIESCDECVVMAESGGGGWEAVYGTEVSAKSSTQSSKSLSSSFSVLPPCNSIVASPDPASVIDEPAPLVTLACS